ncbi:MAG: alpha/beta fold hydrolase [Gemmatimonadota bacterium]|jgi:esterase/lipase
MSAAKVAAAGALALAAVALLGPRARVEDRVRPVTLPADLDAYLSAEEARVPGVRPGDAKTIIWLDSMTRARTPVAVVYLHGFSADRHEIDPVPRRVARALGGNLYYTRLAGHGRDGAAMGDVSAGDWLQDVEEAMAIGRRLGERVVLMGTSTGGTLAVWAAAQDRWKPDLAALVLLSPNFGPRDSRARMLLWPWGKLLARVVVGPERCFRALNPEQQRHWTTCYPTRALLPMMALVDYVRRRDPRKVTTPVLVLYAPEDGVVDPGETRRVFEAMASDPKRMEVLKGSGDPEHHVLAGDILSPGTTDEVTRAILDFVGPLVPRIAATPNPIDSIP